MAKARTQIDKPEPRWQALLGVLAAVGTTFALPRWLGIGPRWLLPLVILVLLVPTVFAHRTGRHSLNHILGTVISSIIMANLALATVIERPRVASSSAAFRHSCRRAPRKRA